MSEVTRILSAIEQGDPHAAGDLLPLVYEELRKLAAQKLAQEAAGQTLQATALVHEAYLRLVDVERAQHWNSRGHFFAAAAEAMRRILVDNARRKQSKKRGGDRARLDLDQFPAATSERGFPLGLCARLAAPLPGRRRPDSVVHARFSKKFARSAGGFRTEGQRPREAGDP
jgi:RNA polymerase sigma factor (TIGR02999 family)